MALEELDGHRPRRDEGLGGEAQEVRREVGRERFELAGGERVGLSVGPHSPDGPGPEAGEVSRAVRGEAAVEAGERPGVVAPGGAVERDLDARRIALRPRLRDVDGERRPAGEARREEHSVGALGGQPAEVARRHGGPGPTLALGITARLAERAERVDQGLAQRAAQTPRSGAWIRARPPARPLELDLEPQVHR